MALQCKLGARPAIVFVSYSLKNTSTICELILYILSKNNNEYEQYKFITWMS